MKQPILLLLPSLLWMHLAFCQPIIKVWGSEDPLTVKKQVEQYLHHLDIQEKMHLAVTFTKRMPDKLKGTTLCQYSSAPQDYQVIKVRIDARLSKKQQELVLAHEMIHVKQFAKGELVVLSDKQVIWKGRKYQHDARHWIPWESEAYQNETC